MRHGVAGSGGGGDTLAMSCGEETILEYECCCEDWNFRGDIMGEKGFMALGCESIKGFPVLDRDIADYSLR